MLAKWKQYQDMDYIYLDCRGLKETEMITILEDAAEIMKPKSEQVFVLANVTGAVIAPEFMERFKALTAEVYKEKVARTAIVGVDGMKSVIIKTYNFIMGRDVHTFASEEEALAYLYSNR
ncbi:hypothetical protein JXO52_06835 [bacterium]|nr:hypothetical protein [bacterium]